MNLALMPGFADTLGGATAYGTLLSVAAVGMLLGSLVVGALLLVILNDDDAVSGFTNILPRNVLAVLGYLLGLGVVVALLSSFL
ncbi:hypothetical protein ACFQRB_19285 [Halobaculum litoreum]|uniref:Uncharacterized protein n=1 Tax=Halobaculum litoreum TaxID=3031998 RepID=A0ABD5XVU3_9EURY